jgi:hypothetical protein
VTSVAPPTINLDNPAVETEINLCANAAQKGEINIVQSNSFGFGGTNACADHGTRVTLMWKHVAANGLSFLILLA